MTNSKREADGPEASGGDLGFDPDALRAKYRAERDKRLRLLWSSSNQIMPYLVSSSLLLIL